MKKILSLVLAALMLLSAVCMFASCGDKEDPNAKAYNNYLAEIKAPENGANGTLKIGTSPDFAPMEFYDLASNKVVGFDILLANYIAKELDMSLEVNPMSFEAVQAGITTGKIDLGLSGFSWTAKRAENYEISDGYEAGDAASDQVVIVKADKGGTFSTPADFAGKKIGAQGASLQELLVNEQLVTAGATIEVNATIDTLIEMLKTGKLDGVALENGNATSVLAANEDLAQSGFQFVVDDMYKFNVVLIKKGNTELLAKVNAAIAKAKQAGVFNAWYEACQIYAETKTADELGFDENGNKITETAEN